MKQKQYDQIRVVASPAGMFVKDARGNNMNVFGAQILLQAGKPPVMQLSLLAQPFDVQGHATFMAQDPTTGQPKPVRKIIWADGTEAEFPDAPQVPVVAKPAEPAGNGQA